MVYLRLNMHWPSTEEIVALADSEYRAEVTVVTKYLIYVPAIT